MQALPTGDLRSNRGTWAVPTEQLPALAGALLDVLPPEPFDSSFLGQRLGTTYFDTPRLALRKARLGKDRYLTLRVRSYPAADGTIYALAAKTEDQKFRVEITPDSARFLLAGNSITTALAALLPPDLQARLAELAGDDPLGPVVRVETRRYAVQDARDRFTLDVDVHTDSGKKLPCHILEYKSTSAGAPPARVAVLDLRPIKLSKFLWATCV